MQVTPDTWTKSIQQLLELERIEHAFLTARHALRAWSHPAQTQELQSLLELLFMFPPQYHVADEWQRLCLAVQEQLGHPYEGQHVADAIKAAKIAVPEQADVPPYRRVFWAWALARDERFEEAEQWAETLLCGNSKALLPEEQILLWRTLGRVHYRTQTEKWPQAFAKALNLAGTSRLAGIIHMEMGITWSYARNEAQAIQCFAKAEPLLQRTALADWPAQSIGFLQLQAGNLPQAEVQFLRAFQLSCNQSSHSRTLSGLAAVRRAYAEWPRAAYLYREAAKLAKACGDSRNLRHALRGEGHTLRLAGEPLEALVPLTQAANCVQADKETGQSWVYADIAAAQASLPLVDIEAIEAALAQCNAQSEEDRGRVQIVRAELRRRQGDEAGARNLLHRLRRDALWLREEAHAFPTLFALLPAPPAPLPRHIPLVVRLQAVGCPAIYVGGRQVEASDKATVALAALLLAGGRCSSEALAEALREEVPAHQPPPSRRAMKQRASKAVSQLRVALGWPGSVRAKGGSYLLDDAATWQCDALELCGAGQAVPEFMAGIYLPWVQEQTEYLSAIEAENLLYN